jgi:gentisate 1,2-dioxygenase
MENYIKAYEYESNVNPSLRKIPILTKNIFDCKERFNWVDLKETYNVDFKATTPNLLACFIKLKPNEQIIESIKKDINGTSHLFYIVHGKGEIVIEDEIWNVYLDDIFVCPCIINSIQIKNTSDEEELHIYYINDSPLLNYLGGFALEKKFKACIYSSDFLHEKLNVLSKPNNNRKGILLSNKDTEQIGVNTITPNLWCLYNELPPNTIQKPHKHNSVALDLCINCLDSENIYTLVGDKLDDEGNIINPTKINWKKGEMFITPPGLWHSHNNLGNTYAYILPIQDAGLLLYQRILGIEIIKD